MDNTINDSENIRAAMELGGGALVFVATISAIVNDRIQKAKNAAHRERIISNIFMAFTVGFSVLGAFFVNNYPKIAMYFMLGSTVVYVVNFIRLGLLGTPATRGEILILVSSVAASLFVTITYMLMRIVDNMDGIIKFLEHLVK